ncbi:hypothetical protein GOBAR_AA03990 [Gossypium barbadense]|uniref:Uncharacterized protein n=1 Tax=Gossypium barbadense TaxID=3634 RepID=A0A2P5YLY3_GOSBA|nr:hypothetical protein GOBAR_AA03990 [Gossypium barbadense]
MGTDRAEGGGRGWVPQSQCPAKRLSWWLWSWSSKTWQLWMVLDCAVVVLKAVCENFGRFVVVPPRCCQIAECNTAQSDEGGQKLQILKQQHELVCGSVVAVMVGPPKMQRYHQEYPWCHPHRILWMPCGDIWPMRVSDEDCAIVFKSPKYCAKRVTYGPMLMTPFRCRSVWWRKARATKYAISKMNDICGGGGGEMVGLHKLVGIESQGSSKFGDTQLLYEAAKAELNSSWAVVFHHHCL